MKNDFQYYQIKEAHAYLLRWARIYRRRGDKKAASVTLQSAIDFRRLYQFAND